MWDVPTNLPWSFPIRDRYGNGKEGITEAATLIARYLDEARISR